MYLIYYHSSCIHLGYAANFGQQPIDENSALQTVEVDVLQQECLVSYNSYFLPHYPGNRELLPPYNNLKNTSSDCCLSCHEYAGCNAWQWCPEEAGCHISNQTRPTFAIDPITFPYMGCQLMYLSKFTSYQADVSTLKIVGPEIPIVAGALFNISVPELSGYKVYVGSDLGGQYDYACTATDAEQIEGRCEIPGTAEKISSLCSADPLCQGFVFFPEGVSLKGTGPVGILKHDPKNSIIPTDELELNPSGSTYLNSNMVTAEGTNTTTATATIETTNNTSTVVAIVVGSVVGVAAIIAFIGMVIYVKRYRKLTRSFPLPETSSQSHNGIILHPNGSGGSGRGGESDTIRSFSRGNSLLIRNGNEIIVLSGTEGGVLVRTSSSEENNNATSNNTSSSKHTNNAMMVNIRDNDETKDGKSSEATSSTGGDGSGSGMHHSAGNNTYYNGDNRMAHPGHLKALSSEYNNDGSDSSAKEISAHQQRYDPTTRTTVAMADMPTQTILGNRETLQQVIVVSEIPPPSALPLSASSTDSQRGSHPGSSTRDLLHAFSQMYKQRPPQVDYDALSSMTHNDDDAMRAARQEEEERLHSEIQEIRKSRQKQSSHGGNGNDFHDGDKKGKDGTEAMAHPHQDQHRAAATGGAPPADQQQQQQQEVKKRITPLEALLADDWSIKPEEVEVCRRPDGTLWQLGAGAFGTVYKGLYHGVHSVAIKFLHRFRDQKHNEAFVREVTLLKALRDRNIVQFLGACLDGPEGTAMLVTELMELGDLWRALSVKDSSGDRIFGWYRYGRRVMEDVAHGLHYLHTKRVVHFDLKSANILLTKAGTAKLADIGMARVMDKSYLTTISGLGTFAWSAPEVLAGKRCSEKADIFSWGVVLWEVCTGEAPVRGALRPLKAPADCPEEIVALFEQCVSEDPEKRPSAKEILDVLARVSGTTTVQRRQ